MEGQVWTVEEFAILHGLERAEVEHRIRRGLLLAVRLSRQTVRILGVRPESAPWPAAERRMIGGPGGPVAILPPPAVDEGPMPLLVKLLADLGMTDSATAYAIRRQIPTMGTAEEQRDAVMRILARAARVPRRAIGVSTRRVVIARDGRVCQYCCHSIGRRARLELDHVRPLANGGSSEPENLVVACSRCNARKAAADGWFDRKCGHPRFDGDGGCGRCRFESRSVRRLGILPPKSATQSAPRGTVTGETGETHDAGVKRAWSG